MESSGEIKAEWFYGNEEGKTKLNWFLYEAALECQSRIRDEARLKAYRESRGERDVAEFCASYAKRMESALSRPEDAAALQEKHVTERYPGMPRRQALLLASVAWEAWESQLSAYALCPTRCLSKRTEKTDLFDRWGDGGGMPMGEAAREALTAFKEELAKLKR